MTELLYSVNSPAQISSAAARLRQSVLQKEITPSSVMAVFEMWARSLNSRELDGLPGIPFLRIWLRRATLEPILERELALNGASDAWSELGRARYRAFPLGVIGHWPAGNIEIQPILSMTCALLGGNAALLRVPSGLVDVTRILIDKLVESDPDGVLTDRIFVASFDHDRRDLHEAMAQSVDGAMIWGGEEAVLQIRSLPFPHWVRIAVFGPRISVAAMDSGAWSNPSEQESWCRRIARDVWQFDQQACSSPHVLFLEKESSQSTEQFISALQRAFEEENQAHPRKEIPSALTSGIIKARADWLIQDDTHRAIFPAGPDWTLLIGSGDDLPQPVQGRTLAVLEVDSLIDPILKFDGNVQTLGLGMADRNKESEVARTAGCRGVDRIVKLGRMHVFLPPWDGVDLIRPMVRLVRHTVSSD